MAPLLPDSNLETPSAAAPLRIGQLEIDLANRRLLRDRRALRLSAIEWHILELLVGHAGQIVTHRMLLQQVWGDAAGASSDYLYTYIRRLRRKLEDDPAHPRYIRTEPGIGYRFVLAYPADAVTPAAPIEAFPHHPVPLTALIGRTQDVLAVRQWIERDDIRLLTLVGPPGVGKTRLGVQVALDLRPAFADGVCFVALAAVRDPRLVPAAIAQALGVADSGGPALVAQHMPIA
jgi:DNA-binding winged helix-turn-helix (wHTH) protein